MGIEDGYLIITGPDGTLERDTVQCAHCNKHYVVRPGSGKRRGWCTMCARATCGAQKCIPCIPFERQLDLFEAKERSIRSMLS
jgi:hypothetical protein